MSCSCGCSKKSVKDWGTLSEFPEFSDLKPGETAEILGYKEGGRLAYKAKLLSLGLVRGAKIRVVQVAPLGDPVSIAVLSYRLSLRKSEASILKLRKV